MCETKFCGSQIATSVWDVVGDMNGKHSIQLSLWFEETCHICLFLVLFKDSEVRADVTQVWKTTKIGILS